MFRLCFSVEEHPINCPSNATIRSKRLSCPLHGTAIKSARNPGRIRPSFPPWLVQGQSRIYRYHLKDFLRRNP